MMDIWVFLSVIAVGPIKECRKLAEGFLNGAMSSHPGSSPSTQVFVNFDLKNNDNTNAENNDNNNNAVEFNLQRICVEKVLSLFEQNRLQQSDISAIPVELLQKIANCIPLLVPTTTADQKMTWEKKLVLPLVKLNFEKQDQFIKKINELRPDLPTNWTDDVNNRQGMIIYAHDRDALQYTKLETLATLYEKNGMNLDVIGRVSCDWDQPTRNNFTNTFVIENHIVVFKRKDLPKVILDDDHVLVKKYGHLLQEWKEIKEDKRLEFDTKEFGTFKLISTWRWED